MSSTLIACHIVFATKHRQPTIPKAFKHELYAYIGGIITNWQSTPIKINGMADHIHVLVDVHPTKSIADLVKTIKQASAFWMKNSGNFPDFDKWAEGYFAESISARALPACKNYIANQENHHQIYPFFTEIEKLYLKNGMTWDNRSWT